MLFFKDLVIRLFRKTGFSLLLFKISWKLKNRHNKTSPACHFDPNRVSVGAASYGPLHILSWGAPGERLQIGHYVSIASDVQFILGGNHRTDIFSTFPFQVMFWGAEHEATTKGPILVEDDVWVGTRATILSGVTLGRGCVVAAGSVVTKSVPPFAIVGGNPARVIKYRFSDEICQQLLKIDFAKTDWRSRKDLKELLYKHLDQNVLNEITSLVTRDR